MTHDTPARTVPLRQLRLLGLVAPLVFVITLLSLRPWVIETLGLRTGHLVLGTVLLTSVLVFGWGMYRLIDRTHQAVVEAERQSAALVERDRIAREMHDSLAQVLAVAHLRLRALETRPSVAGDERVRADIDDLATLCREAQRDVREAIVGLKDAHHPERSLLEHLDAFVSVFSRTSGIRTTLHADTAAELNLSPAAEVQVIRVAQEALANIRKHAGATHAAVRVTTRDGHTEFVVEDDGVGFDPGHPRGSDGFGLVTMRERTESAGGTLHLDAAPGRGTRVVVTLPDAAPARPAVQTRLAAPAPARVGEAVA